MDNHVWVRLYRAVPFLQEAKTVVYRLENAENKRRIRVIERRAHELRQAETDLELLPEAAELLAVYLFQNGVAAGDLAAVTEDAVKEWEKYGYSCFDCR